MAFNSQAFETYKKQKLNIAKTNYEHASRYYYELKNKFLESLNDSLLESGKEIKADYFQEIIQDGLTEKIDYTDLMNKYGEVIEGYLQTRLNSSQSLEQALLSSIDQAKKTISKKEFESDSKEFKALWKEVSDNFDKDFTTFNILEEAQREALKALNAVGYEIGSASITGAYSFYKRTLFNTILNKHGNNIGLKSTMLKKVYSSQAKRGYGFLIGGYIREALTTKVIDNFLKNNKSFYHVRQTNDANPYYDIVMTNSKDINKVFGKNGLLQEELENLESFQPGEASIDYNELLETATPYFGIQSKSWKTPNDLIAGGKNLRNQWFKIGNRKDILDKMPGANSTPNNGSDPGAYSWDRGWHNYVSICSKIIYQLLGQYQVAYSLPGTFIWTYDLIKQMHDNNLYLNFYFTRKRGEDGVGHFNYPATEEVAWQKQLYLYSFYTDKMRKNNK